MAREFYGFFDSTTTDERIYQADEFAEAFRALGGTGVGKGLQPSPAGGLNVKISPGLAMIRGYTYALTDDGGSPKTMALAVSGSAGRIDRIILRLDLSAGARSIKMIVLQGTPGANPAPRPLTNTALVKEISLCQIRVEAAASAVTLEDITDEHLDAAVCGILAPEELQLDKLDARYPSKEDLKALEELSDGAVMKTDVANNLTTTAANKVLDARQGKALDGRLKTVETDKAEVESFGATLPASGWSQSAPHTHTQTVSVSGLTAAMTPFADVALSGTPETAMAELEAWALVGKIETGDGTLTATCYEDRPETGLTLRLVNIA